MAHDLVLVAVVLLGAAVLAVPLTKRLGLGSIIGYLAAGIAVGPAGFGLVPDAGSIHGAAELGVVMLLFLIGLELKPSRLWVMRRAVFLMGGLQVAATAAVMALGGYLLGLGAGAATAVGCGLALSSTALVLPMLAERGLLGSPAGRDGFGILLFQDLAIIPMVALLPLLGAETGDGPAPPVWRMLLQVALGIGTILVGGRFLVPLLFRVVAATGTREIFFATALLIVFGTAALADAAGLSMSLGAFLGGVLLADSEYRHELQADIEPFEGLLLGLFFVSIGMTMGFGQLMEAPLAVAALVVAVVAGKALLVFGIARLFRHDAGSALRMGISLAQGGEFALVLFGFAAAGGLLADADRQLLTLVVVLSMMATPLLFAAEERWSAARLARAMAAERPFDEIKDEGAPVILCGVGRMGQIVARILRLRDIPFTALEMSHEQLDVIRRFGHKVYFGDPSRLDLLRSAGAERARVLVVAVDDVELSLKIVDTARRHFPHLRIVARARNRRHAHHLMDRNVRAIVRETFHSSLVLTRRVLEAVGLPAAEIERVVETFREHDERQLVRQHAIHADEQQLIQSAKQAAEELRGILREDRPERGIERQAG
ncbi:MAG TPA: monovalent cation:proton antiporter-2 (CPA2) family protein [Geminicoccaceae bacterium]|nr:monovalent cation:proton antiporter-2 (CPA2) family protein [Geminicoccaceae bacterium]